MPDQKSSMSYQYKRMCSRANLNLAWERLMRSGDSFNKWFWRDSAAGAALARQSIIRRLSSELQLGTYEPDHTCIVSVPKESGLLRHHSICSFGDHLVYQAVINVIADKAYPTLRKEYFKLAFSNLYSGRGCKYFYRPWKVGYLAFNTATKSAWKGDRRWIGEYDFASFYESIDHRALRDMLRADVNIDDDVTELLESILRCWSSTDGSPGTLRRRYLGHGIPQGAYPSRFLSEIPLHYIDRNMGRLPDITYLRYADDIRILGETHLSVRVATAHLEKLARNIGLFSQKSKFDIRLVDDIDDVLKTISMPEGQPGALPADVVGVDPEDEPLQMLRRIIEDRDYKNLTRFRWLIGVAESDPDVAEELTNLISVHPHLSDTFIN